VQNNEHNVAQKQNKEQKPHYHLNRCGKNLSQSSTFLHNKIPEELGIEGMCLKIKSMYDKLIANIIQNLKKLKAFPLSQELLFNIIVELLTREIREEKEIKGIQIGKDVKLSLFVDDTILSLKD
jgi:Na+/glutamate symporter